MYIDHFDRVKCETEFEWDDMKSQKWINNARTQNGAHSERTARQGSRKNSTIYFWFSLK